MEKGLCFISPFFYEITGTISFSKNRTLKTLLFNYRCRTGNYSYCTDFNEFIYIFAASFNLD